MPLHDRTQCVGCRKRPPQGTSAHALIQASWRLSRARFSNDERHVVWRCDLCWRAYKSRLITMDAAGH